MNDWSVFCLTMVEVAMVRLRFFQSVVFQLVSCLVLGGVVVSLGLGVLELRRSEATLGMEIAQRTLLTVRHLQSVLRGILPMNDSRAVQDVMGVYLSDGRIRAMRVHLPQSPTISLGDWPKEAARVVVWSQDEHAMMAGQAMSIDKLTLIRAPFQDQGQVVVLELLIDGPAARQQLQARLIDQLGLQMLLLAMVVLMGLLLLRRWFTGPLSQIALHVRQHAGPEPFFHLARQMRGEFAQLAQAVGGMLRRLEVVNAQLRRRERAFEHLYQYAPAAMVSLDGHSRITEANRKAAELLDLRHERDLLGRLVLDFIRPQDRGVFHQHLERLAMEDASRCHLRLQVAKRELDVCVESTAVRDEQSLLQNVRLSLLDVSEATQLQRQLGEKSHLLNLVMDHMSDGMLLVDAQGVVAACNEPLARWLNHRASALVGRVYNPETFWDGLGVTDHDAFVWKMRQIEAQKGRSAQACFESRIGRFEFQSIGVHDALGVHMGQLWVVGDVTSQQQSEMLLAQQSRQLNMLRQLGQQFGQVVDLDAMLDQVARHVYAMFEVEAVGVALRHDGRDGRGRSRQILHRGGDVCLLEPNRHLMQATEAHLMPRVVASQHVTHWPELSPNEDWTLPWRQAGLTALAGCPLQGQGETKGIVWIARRGGRKIQGHHLYLLEALAPLIASRVQIAQLHDKLHELELTDSLTHLPNAAQFEMQLARLSKRVGLPWSAMLVKIDRFHHLNGLLPAEGGDQLLREVGGLLQSAVRQGCVTCRLRAAVFGLVLPGHDRDLAMKLAQRLRDRLAGHKVTLAQQEPDSLPWSLTASIGLVSSPDDGGDARSLQAILEARLEAARRAGRDGMVATGLGDDRQAG